MALWRREATATLGFLGRRPINRLGLVERSGSLGPHRASAALHVAAGSVHIGRLQPTTSRQDRATDLAVVQLAAILGELLEHSGGLGVRGEDDLDDPAV